MYKRQALHSSCCISGCPLLVREYAFESYCVPNINCHYSYVCVISNITFFVLHAVTLAPLFLIFVFFVSCLIYHLFVLPKRFTNLTLWSPLPPAPCLLYTSPVARQGYLAKHFFDWPLYKHVCCPMYQQQAFPLSGQFFFSIFSLFSLMFIYYGRYFFRQYCYFKYIFISWTLLFLSTSSFALVFGVMLSLLQLTLSLLMIFCKLLRFSVSSSFSLTYWMSVSLKVF